MRSMPLRQCTYDLVTDLATEIDSRLPRTRVPTRDGSSSSIPYRRPCDLFRSPVGVLVGGSAEARSHDRILRDMESLCV